MGEQNKNVQTLSQHDRDIIRGLAERKVLLSADPVNVERREAWYALDAGKNERVMILAEHGGVRDARKPGVVDDALHCEDEWARGIERALRTAIYQFEELRDDHVIEPFWNVRWRVRTSNYGVEAVVHRGGDETHMGSCSWDPPIKDLDADFDKLHPRTFEVDRAASLAEKARLEQLFGDILPLRIRGSFYWTMGLTGKAIMLIGLEGLMLAMYDNPSGLHRLMTFLRDDALAFFDWLEREELYTLNNENDYIGAGSMGYTHDLPQANDGLGGAAVRTRDLWVLGESQETVGVSPDMFEEFVFPYQLSISERFGKTYYGCCEPVNSRWDVLKRLPNLARVSVSPWADQPFMAEALGRDVVFSRKPKPTQISTATFDEKAIRADLRETLAAASGCRLEIIMKDVHTLNNEPERLPRWVRIAREETGQA